MTKRALVEQYVKEGEYKKALAICKSWNLPISKEESETLQRGYECMHYPRLYESIGYKPELEAQRAIGILKKIYIK